MENKNRNKNQYLRDILVKIIEQDGDCNGLNQDQCAVYPLSNIPGRSCWDFVGITCNNYSMAKEVDEHFLKAAKKALIEMDINLFLEEEE
jgi:hypothetical protein